MEPDFWGDILRALGFEVDYKMPGLNVMPPEERRRGVEFDPGDQGTQESREMIADLANSPFVQDTLASVFSTLEPGTSIGTKGSTGMISNVMAHFRPSTREIEIEADLPKAISAGMFHSLDAEDPEGELRRVLSHEAGHAVSHEMTWDTEATADLIGQVFTELSRTNRDRTATPSSILQNAVRAEEGRRSEALAALGGDAGRYSPYYGEVHENDVKRAEHVLEELLEMVPVYSAHPARFNR